MAEEKEKKEEGWAVGLSIVDENQPPVKLFHKEGTKEPLDLYGIIAGLRNDVEQLKKLL